MGPYACGSHPAVESYEAKSVEQKFISVSDQPVDETACRTEESRLLSAIFKDGFVPIALAAIDVGILVLCYILNHCIQNESAWVQRGRCGPEFDVPCSMVSLSLEEDRETFDSSKHDVRLYTDANGRRTCAFSNITAVVEKATERKARLRVAEGRAQLRGFKCGRFSNKPRSGDYVAYFSKLESNNGTVTKRTGARDEVLLWSDDPSNSFVGRGVSFSNGRIRVDIGQFYFVYALVAFNKSSETRRSDRGFSSSVFVVDIVTAVRDGGAEVRTRELQFAEAIGDCADGVGTAFVGSQVYLNSRDELFVTVNDGKRVLQGSRGNAFGIYAL